MTFLAPLLAGIVIGLALMISAILNTLGGATAGLSLGGDTGGINIQTITGIFKIETMIPPYFLQIAIGIYLIEVIFILTGTLVTIDSGEDKLERTSRIGANLRSGMVFYFITALLASVALFALSSIVLKGVLS